MSDDPASVESFEWETTMAFAKQLADPWQGMGEMANHQRRLAAEMIVKLYNRCTMEALHIMEIRQQVKELRGERDEARREVCRSRASCIQGKSPLHIAEALGWDCFSDQTADTSEHL